MINFLTVNICLIISHLWEEGAEEKPLRWPIDIDSALKKKKTKAGDTLLGTQALYHTSHSGESKS